MAHPPVVLIADDDPTSRALIAAALQGHIGAAIEAEDGMAALQALERQAFDLAIVDLDMPVVDGFGVIERARARAETHHLPIIVVTGRDDVVAIERAFALGATSFLCKPLNWNVFRHQVDYVLQVARVEQETRLAKERAERLAALRDRALAVLGKEIGDAVAKLAAISGEGAAASLAEIFAAGERLNAVLARVRRASDILTELAAFEPAPVAAVDVVEQALGAIRAAHGPEAADRIDLVATGPLQVQCDRGLAAEALFEILQNALLYSPLHERIRLGIVRAAGCRVCFEVEDRGPGIPEAMLEGGFYALRPGVGAPGRQTGLGIAVVEAIISRHGGHFGIMSEVGRGTEVFLSFPCPTDREQGEGELKPTARIFGTELSKAAGVAAS